VKSEVKRRELEEQIRLEKQKREQAEQERQAKEMEELEAIERELLAKRIASKMDKKALDETNSRSLNTDATKINNNTTQIEQETDTNKPYNEYEDSDAYLEELLNAELKKS
jgi:hypothetical protein